LYHFAHFARPCAAGCGPPPASGRRRGVDRARGRRRHLDSRVAEQAGGTKPVTYEHFETHTGLLAALRRRTDDQQTAAAREALDARAGDPEEAVLILAAAYVDCTLGSGRESDTVTAALGSVAGVQDRTKRAPGHGPAWHVRVR
jgi:AcrR family transcriptional regulator